MENTDTSESILQNEKLVQEPELNEFEQFGHVAMIGPTESGKTTRFKFFVLDNKFPVKDIDTFIYCGPPKQMEEVFATWTVVTHDAGKIKQMKALYYKLDEMEKALLYCSSNEHFKENKLIFLDDALIISSQLNNKISTWIHQAKNYNTTVVISVHEAFGSKCEKMVRTACRYFVGINLEPQQTARLLTLPVDNPLVKTLESETDPHKKLFIYDKKMHEIFNENYHRFNSLVHSNE